MLNFLKKQVNPIKSANKDTHKLQQNWQFQVLPANGELDENHIDQERQNQAQQVSGEIR